MVAFDGHLFIPPTDEGTSFNSNRASVILRSADPLEGVWEAACEPGFGDSTNNGIFELAVFDGHLYAGTFNQYQGYQVWKTPATGDAPCCWTKVIERGAGRGNLNEIAMSLCPFDDALYVGSAIQNGGYDRTNQVGPAAGELIRIYPDDSWELVVGTPRRVLDGMKYPLSGMGPGFDNVFAGYMWRMVVHEGWLYASTFDWSVFLPYAGRPSRTAMRMMRELGVEHIVRHGGGFELWRSRNGTDWVPVTQNGLGNPYNYGARNMVSTPQGLFLGTANPFGPEVAAQIAGDWIYVPNPHGGAEVWLGRSPADRVSPEPAETPRARRKKGPTSPPVLLTGATGFIGSHVLERLLARGDQVRVLALPETAGDVGHRDRVEIVTGDLAEEAALEEAVRGVEVVYHLAALLPGSPPTELRAVNVGGTENLLRACGRVGGVRRLVFTSSTAVYAGRLSPEEWPLKETSRLGARGPESLRSYGRSKAAAEALVQHYAPDFGFEFTILRPPVCYGVGSRFAEDLVQAALADRGADRTRIASELLMQLIHVRDLAATIAEVGICPNAANEIFNVAGIETLSFRTIAAMIRRLKGRANRSTLVPDRSRIWQRYVLMYDVSKAQRRLGFMPRVTSQEGLAEVVAAVNGRNGPDFQHDGRYQDWRGGPWRSFEGLIL
jgi:nucleoside-diphosphate-sugar epimerase